MPRGPPGRDIAHHRCSVRTKEHVPPHRSVLLAHGVLSYLLCRNTYLARSEAEHTRGSGVAVHFVEAYANFPTLQKTLFCQHTYFARSEAEHTGWGAVASLHP